MKKTIGRTIMIIALILTVSAMKAQDAEPAMKAVAFEEVVTVNGAKADAVYQNLKKWVAKFYVDAETVTKYDLDNKEIFVKGRFEFFDNSLNYSHSTGHVGYFLDIKIKDGRFKMTMNNFCHRSADGNFYDELGTIYEQLPTSDQLKAMGWKKFYQSAYKGMYKRIMPKCEPEWEELKASIENYMKNASEQKEDDW